MDKGTIADINNLKFYTDNGIEIYTEKKYTINWKFKNENDRFRVLPEGFIIADIIPAIDYPDIYVIDPNSIQIGFTQYPEIYLNTTETNVDVIYFDVLDALTKNYIFGNYEKTKITEEKNIIEITIDLLNGNLINFEIPADKFFGVGIVTHTKYIINGDTDDEDDLTAYQFVAQVTSIDTYIDETGIPYIWKVLAGLPYSKYDYIHNAKAHQLLALKLGERTQYDYTPGICEKFCKPVIDETPNQSNVFNLIDEPESFKLDRYKLTSDIIVKDTENEGSISIHINKDEYTEEEYKYIRCLSSALALFFPFIIYQGSIKQEPVSTDFYAANTLILLEENLSYDENDDEVRTYEYPALNALDTNWEMQFSVPEASEIRILKTFNNVELTPVLQENKSLAVTNTEYEPGVANPMCICIGVKASQEGVYLNYLGIYLTNSNIDRSFFLGVIAVKTEIIGEDERYRTLMENFGIPDPATYATLFADLEYDEMLCNWDFINKKCKELMLIYPEIFPFAGTYKGIINALKYLGYDDIIIKEWYNIIDNNGQEKNIAFNSIDIANGQLTSLLKLYNVDYETDLKYNKLNQISLIYHINEVIEKDKIDDQYLLKSVVKNGETTYDRLTYSEVIPFDIPLTLPIYTYRNDEILAKLFSMKKWLESFIVGVNVRITDITAEGIYFIPYQTICYNNNTLKNDFITSDYVTPKVISSTKLENSEATIVSTLSEFKNISFGEYDNKSWESFKKVKKDISDNTIGQIYSDFSAEKMPMDIKSNINSFNVSNTFGAPVYTDEYTFELVVKPSSGSLYPYVKGDDNQIIIADDKIELLKEDSHTATFDPECLPIVYIELGNIRYMNGDWTNNIAWLINEIYDSTDYTSIYHVQPKFKPTPGYDCYTHVMLIPGENATLKYTADVKWQAPVFVFTNYKFAFYSKDIDDSVSFDIPKDKPFILEILRGSMSFSDKNSKYSTNINFYQEGTEYNFKTCELTYIYRNNTQSVVSYTNEISKFLYETIIENNINIKNLTIDDYNNFIIKTLHLDTNINDSNIIDNILIQPFLYKESNKINPFGILYELNDKGKYVYNANNLFEYQKDEDGNIKYFIHKQKINEDGTLAYEEKLIPVYDAYGIQIRNEFNELVFDTELIPIYTDEIITTIEIDDDGNEVIVEKYDTDKWLKDDDGNIITDDEGNNKIDLSKWTEPIKGNYANSDIIKYWTDFLIRKLSAEIQDEFLDLLDNLYKNNITNNLEISSVVHHLGNYKIIAKVYDRYNNIYINEKEKAANIIAVEPTFNMITNLDYSKNDPEFCKENVIGTYLFDDDIDKIKELTKNETEIKYTVNWPIYQIQYYLDEPDNISWWNYSYAEHTPLAGEYINFRNTLDKVGKIEIIDQDHVEFYLYNKDDTKRLYQPGNYAYVYAINEVTQEIIANENVNLWNLKIGNIEIINDNHSVYEYKLSFNISMYDNNVLRYIKTYVNEFNSGNLSLYLVPGISYTFGSYDNIQNYISNDYEKTEASITIPNNEKTIFAIGDVIKLTYDCKIYDAFSIDIPYKNNEIDKDEYFLAASYDFSRPCLYILYEEIENDIVISKHEEIEISTLELYEKDFKNISNNNIKLVLFLKQYINDPELYAFLLKEPHIPDINEIKELLSFTYDDVITYNIPEDGFIEAISYDLQFGDEPDENGLANVHIEFPNNHGKQINLLHNEVTYRINDIVLNKRYSREKGDYIDYTYILNNLIDIHWINRYNNHPLYDLKITLSYPYKNAVNYSTVAKADSISILMLYGESGYSLLNTNQKIDVDRLFLDSYLDSNFQAITSEYEPEYIRESFIPYKENIITLINIETGEKNEIIENNIILYNDNTDSYLYHDLAITISNNQMVQFLIDNDFKGFDNIEEIEWKGYTNVFDPYESSSYTELHSNKQCLFKIRNKTFCIKPLSIGSHDIHLGIWDKYGNYLTNEFNGALYVKE